MLLVLMALVQGYPHVGVLRRRSSERAAVGARMSFDLPIPTEELLPVGTGVVAGGAVATVGKALIEALVLPTLFKDANLKNSIPSTRYELGKRLGQGAYGTVYQGLDAAGTPAVVIKETNLNGDINGRDFALAELYINQKLKTCGQSGRVAQYIGHFNSVGAVPYFSVVYKNEGSLTLMAALKDKGFPLNLEEGLKLGSKGGGDEEVRGAKVIRRITGHLFDNLKGIHQWNVVHRDVKGENLLLSVAEGRFKLIDFGGACDLVTKTNYREDLQVFDPSYGPPEAPPVGRGGKGGIVLSTGGRFDVFSAGLVVMQMCFAPLRTDVAISRFKSNLGGFGYDLEAWRAQFEANPQYARGFAILDQNGGWKLVKACLKEDPGQRISSAAAASSSFCRA